MQQLEISGDNILASSDRSKPAFCFVAFSEASD